MKKTKEKHPNLKRIQDSPYYLTGYIRGLSALLAYRYKDDEDAQRLVKHADKLYEKINSLDIKPF